MAKFSDCNTITSSTTGVPTFIFKQTLKAAGWTVPSSSDGLTYNASGDQITTSGTGAGGLQNTRSWFRLRDPGGRRELCIQYASISGSLQWRVKFSEVSRFTGGSPSATVTPTAADERVVWGGGTDASPTGSYIWSSISARVHVIANSTPIGGVYPFIAFCTITPGSTAIGGFMCMEPMAPGSYDALDVSPVIMNFSDASGVPSSWQGWLAYGTGSQVWITSFVSANATFNGGLPPDLVTGKDVNGRPIYTATSGGTRIKGYGATIALKGPSRTFPATANRAVDAYVYLGAYAIPYADNTEPGV